MGLTLLIMAVLCCMLAWRVKGQIKDNRIGFDRSQLEPTRVATFLIIGENIGMDGGQFFPESMWAWECMSFPEWATLLPQLTTLPV